MGFGSIEMWLSVFLETRMRGRKVRSCWTGGRRDWRKLKRNRESRRAKMKSCGRDKLKRRGKERKKLGYILGQVFKLKSHDTIF